MSLLLIVVDVSTNHSNVQINSPVGYQKNIEILLKTISLKVFSKLVLRRRTLNQ